MAIGSGTSARNLGIWGWQQAQDAKTQGQDLLDGSQGSALLALGKNFGQARDDLTGSYGSAVSRLDPWVSAGTGALSTYQGALGLGSDADRESAVSSFKNSPGYEYAVDQATDAVARKASAMGTLGSGNTAAAISDRAQSMQNQEYGSWLDRVNGISSQGQSAATTQAGLEGQLGNSLANLGQSQGTAEAGLYGQYAGMGLSNLWNATNSGISSVNAAGKSASDSVNSGYSLGANILGSGVNLLTLGMRPTSTSMSRSL